MNNNFLESIKNELISTISQVDLVGQACFCRDKLQQVIAFLYEKHNTQIPQTASLLELIDSPLINLYIIDKEVIDSLHYIRILGMNAKHGRKIKKSEAKLACQNLSVFIDYLIAVNNNVNSNKNIVFAKLPYMSEANTRKLYIDLYLNEANWEVLETENLIIPTKAAVEIKVEGMPTESGIGFCDYVLYGKDGKPLAIVEAKKTSVSPESGRQQVKLYGECFKQKFGYTPVLYYTNGYTIRCIDGLYPDRTLFSFHTQNELELLIQRRNRKNITDLRLQENITNRHYQIEAIKNVCERFNGLQRRSLIVMATGTGKTRVSISLVDVLARNQWVKNVLFLADRTSLVSQAHKNFVKLLPEQSFSVLSDKSVAKNLNARIIFSTYQTMINYIDGEDKKFPTGRFDLIIIDEAHRSIFNKYSSIFSYFDSLLVGLTATPKGEVDANTYRIFDCESGVPNFNYSLEDAVKDGYLVPYKVINRTTKLLRDGIRYADLSQEEKQHIEEAFSGTSPEMGFDVEQNKLFKSVYNETTCDEVLQELMQMGEKIESGDKLGKTIIFAFNHRHAQMIVERFHSLYPQYGAGFCQLIDNTVNYADSLINEFETSPNFQIAVSVDMLDTGIDIPAVLNLVFFKRVKSKIKFVQMIGRGTRLCPNLFAPKKDKKHFLIFDYCNNFEYFDKQIETAIVNTSISITQRLFIVRLAILVELQKIEHQEIEFNKQYYLNLRTLLHSEIKAIRAKKNRIQVREAMIYVDKYYQDDIWLGLSPVEQKEIEIHLVPLLDSNSNDTELTKIFDVRMLNIEIALLTTNSIEKAAKDIKVVREVAQYLLEKASIPQIMEKSDYLKALVSENFWTNVAVERLEIIRENIRELMCFLENSGTKQIIIHIDDETTAAPTIEGGLIDIRTYKQKVIDYLAEHMDSAVLQKIKNLEKINSEDLKVLEDILWNKLGSKDEYNENSDTDNLAIFIRSLIGLEQRVINEKFGEFLNGNTLNSQQQEFVKSIINYVRENGNISKEDLLEKTPFSDYDIVNLFGDKVSVILNIIDTMQNSVIVAA